MDILGTGQVDPREQDKGHEIGPRPGWSPVLDPALQRSRVADTTIAKQSPPSSPVLPPPSAQPSTTAVVPAFTHRRQPSLRPTVSHSGEVAIDEDDRHLTCETPLRYFSGDVSDSGNDNTNNEQESNDLLDDDADDYRNEEDEDDEEELDAILLLLLCITMKRSLMLYSVCNEVL
nr:hypothetical protein Iba_chr06cCG13560 [Ipomoea batatas]